jgi:hypothetical protein
MSSKARRTLAGVAAAAMIAVPAAQARPIDPVDPPHPARVAPPPSSIAQSVGSAYADLRMPDRGTTNAVRPRPVATSEGFDWPSAAVGAALAAGLALLAWMALAMRRLIARRAVSA